MGEVWQLDNQFKWPFYLPNLLEDDGSARKCGENRTIQVYFIVLDDIYLSLIGKNLIVWIILIQYHHITLERIIAPQLLYSSICYVWNLTLRARGNCRLSVLIFRIVYFSLWMKHFEMWQRRWVMSANSFLNSSTSLNSSSISKSTTLGSCNQRNVCIMWFFLPGLIKTRTNLLCIIAKAWRVTTYLCICTNGSTWYLASNNEERRLNRISTNSTISHTRMNSTSMPFRMKKNVSVTRVKSFISDSVHHNS